jgi:hypothetical protein
MNMLKGALKFFVITIIGITVVLSSVTIEQAMQTFAVMKTYTEISARTAVRSFENEANISLYMNGGAMSSSYNNYLNWLGTYSQTYDVSTYLRNEFANGIIPSNMGLPYLDKDKLLEKYKIMATADLDKLLSESKGTIYTFTNPRFEITNMQYEMHDLTTENRLFGASGNDNTFNTNDTGDRLWITQYILHIQ